MQRNVKRSEKKHKQMREWKENTQTIPTVKTDEFITETKTRIFKC